LSCNGFFRIMDATGCSNSPLEAYECLQGLPWEDIVDALPEFKARGTVDDQRSDNPFLPDRPENLIASGNFHQVGFVPFE